MDRSASSSYEIAAPFFPSPCWCGNDQTTGGHYHGQYEYGTFDPIPTTNVSAKLIGLPIDPDLLGVEDLGEAVLVRGRIVRGFFRLLDFVYRR